MAIAATPVNFFVQTANIQNLVSWDPAVGAVSYDVQRSTDGVNYTSVATPTSSSYLDTAVSLNNEYFYKVAAVNGSGTSAYTTAASVIPAPQGEMALGTIRLQAKRKADMLNSNYVTKAEWNDYINRSMFELYDLLTTVYEDYFMATPLIITVDGVNGNYDLPDGILYNGAAPFYKLLGVDLALNTSTNAWVTLDKFNFMDRNRYVYPNTSSTIYGVFNLQYRVMGNKINLIPIPTANQNIRLNYIPRLTSLLKDTDYTTIGTSGWIEYVIIRAAKFALDREESDSSKLTEELVYLKQRIEESASNRDAGRPDRITDVRLNGFWGSSSGGYGNNGPIGGF